MELGKEDKQAVLSLIEEGVLLSGEGLGKMSGTQWDVMTTSVDEIPAVHLLQRFLRSRNIHVGALLRAESGIPAEFLILFTEASARSLAEGILAPYAARLKDVPDTLAATIGEVSNVLAQRVVGVLADKYEATCILSVPEVSTNRKGELLTSALARYDGRQDFLLTVRVEMYSEGLSTECGMVIAFDSKALERLISGGSV